MSAIGVQIAVLSSIIHSLTVLIAVTRYKPYRFPPRKNTATVPGPEWDPITGPMVFIIMSLTFILDLIRSAM